MLGSYNTTFPWKPREKVRKWSVLPITFRTLPFPTYSELKVQVEIILVPKYVRTVITERVWEEWYI